MIRYVGGKSRLAKEITEQLRMRVSSNTARYIEPFMGGGGMLEQTSTLGLPRVCSDYSYDLIILFRAIQDGWLPPETISEQQYAEAKASAISSPLRSYIGFACSYGGKWFGGYARDKTAKRDLTNESYRRIIKSRDALAGIDLACGSYQAISPRSGDLVYCDPPYAGTLGYGNSFNHQEFWDTIRDWSLTGATVLVSEYVAPDDFSCVWSKDYKTYIHHESTSNVKTERLFMWNGYTQS